tara:strand:- start:51539 stop:51892 length:354 start_codon:yes stop_codon:yes gene_type:complete
LELLFEKLITNPVLLSVAIVLAILILFSIIKKLLKITLITISLLALYLGYLLYTGKEVPKTADELKDSLQEKSGEVKEVLDKTVQEMNRSLKEKTSEIMEDKLDKLFNDSTEVDLNE